MPLQSVDIQGKPVEILHPSSPPAGVVVFLHGYDGLMLRDNEIYQRALDRERLACICPVGPQCWWTDALYEGYDSTLSPLQVLHEQLLPDIREQFPNLGEQLGVFGVEMGGQGALQLAYRWPRIFSTVVAVSPKIDFETWHGHGTTLDEIFPDREAARQRTATLQLQGLNWPKRQLLLCDPADHYCLDGCVTLASKLSSSGVPFESDFETTHGGYGWSYANAMADRVVTYLSGAFRRSAN